MPTIKRDLISILKFGLQMIGVWILAFLVFMILRNVGITNSQYYQPKKDFNLFTEFTAAIFLGIITGVFYTILEILLDKPYFQKMSFGKLILLKNIFYFLAAKIIFFLAVVFYIWLINAEWDISLIQEAMSSSNFWIILMFFMMVSILLTFFLQVSQKFGPGMLWNFFIGTYHKPKEEERIFLFIDLRSSTTIAEQLGHIKFSQLLQDCFFDLTDVITKHKVDIYQYVGDEAVLSWKKDKGITQQRCLRAYYDFMKILKSRKEYYLEQYGLEPFFKAGMHMGTVTVAEVGVVKREIAYHGDVLNTAARIQGECNKLGQAFLVSETIVNQTDLGKHFTSELMETPLLKGKTEKVKIYGIRPIED